MAQLIGKIALFDKPDLVVMSSGVGAGAFERYKVHMSAALDELRASDNTNLGLSLEALRVAAIPTEYTDISELYGAPVLMAAHALRRRAS
jgi:hypothetical protein